MLRSPAKQAERRQRLMPNGIPRWVRIYDNGGEMADRFLCVYTGLYNNLSGQTHPNIYYSRSMSYNPFHPQGVAMFDVTEQIVDKYGNNWAGPSIGRKHPRLGRRIRFEDLPTPCKDLVVSDYVAIWELDD